MDRLYHSLLLRAPQRSPSGLYEACVIRTPVMRFEMRRVRGRFTPHLTLKQNWSSDKGEVVLFPVKVDESFKAHLVLLLEATWTYHVLPELHKRGLGQGALFAVQVLYPAGQQPFVRLDEEVRVRATMLARREGWLSDPGLLLRLNPGLVRQSATRRVIDMELLDDERTRYGHFTCLRVDAYWQGIIDLVGLLPKSVQDVIEAWEHSPLSRGIILSGYGDDLAKGKLLGQLGVDMCSLPWPLNEEAPNLVHASVYQAYEDTPVQQMPSVISHRITEELWRESESLNWDRFLDHPDRLAVSPEEASELKQVAEQWFTAAGLSREERAILKLNVILECRKEKWKRRQKAKYLNMSIKNYEKHLSHARMALRMARRKPIAGAYKRLLDEILKGG